jgi:hypothetical protein
VVERRFAVASMTGPCKACGAQVELSIPIEIDSNDKAAMCNWPQEPIKGLFCICGEQFPLNPFPEDFAYKLQNPGAGLLMQEVYSHLAKDDVFNETSALIDFVDGALAMQKPGLAYSLLAGVMRSHPEKWVVRSLREAMEIAAHASGDELVFVSGQMKPALEDFSDWCSRQKEQVPFRELFDVPVWSVIVCDVETKRPHRGTISGVIGEPPEPKTAAVICCRILSGVCKLRHEASEGVLSGESKALMTLRMVWPDLDQNIREGLSHDFNQLTNNEFKERYDF